ncbi:ABC transporter ATP-binding protein [Clostridium botulinum]|uniref:ABC transporter, ATP-binding/permease protein n=1 Tax=Clostridium botulinum (strain Eklund 17B / Type B) TaxID=935198 RepID=B2TPI2_CLOBB|nr:MULTISPECIES: ABC transporter ATP-binding protein [unclassified Clostridium]ACD21789.1 ABC transporter, ATP-binding/permease protein [Clostridium botulinum B str. Eklund 17B (NRP)]MBN1053089.1 ABC transporter ATP-binding protein [Clostridium botulinum]MBY6975323.1 ABC transporter ATP-binding protein [Clostridium botulinum]MBY7000872.1 ABC transporter ATP-binding protein [Clostridium botulinum]MCR1273638.1 ABC transporter ATP-binding protein/permease [Clostridium botulinum]
MLKLLKHLKKSVWLILAILVLLVGQAVCDLTLPKYTSDIVNVGIQHGGVDKITPDVIRESEMERLSLFIEDKDYKEVLENYDLVNKGSTSDEEYPLLEVENLYVLKNIDKDKIEELNSIFGKPMVMVSNFESDSDKVKAMENQMISSFPPGVLKEDANIFDIFKIMPEEQFKEITSSMNEMFSKLDDSSIEQMAVSFVKNEYTKIGVNMDKYQTNYIFSSGAKMLGFALVSMIATILVTLIASRVAATFSRDLRSSVFKKVVGFTNKEFDDFSTASLITRCTNDIQQIQILTVMVLRFVLYAPILGIGGFIKVLNTNSTMSWVIGVAILAILSLVSVLFAIAMPKFKKLQKLVDKINLVAREILTGIPVIRAFSTEKHEEERFDKANKELTDVNLFVNKIMACMMPAMMFIMNGITVLIVWVGASKIENATMQVGDLMAFIQYTMQIIMAFLMLSMISIMISRAAVSAKRIAEVLDTEGLIKDPVSVKSFDNNKKGYVEFKNVNFRYPKAEEDVLSNINFTAKPGETTAIIGSTGSGKTTLVNLIPRFFDTTEGEILVDGVDVRNVTQHDLRDKIGYVPQKGMLFSGTIESNIKYGAENAPKEVIMNAARVAQATEFIEAKDDTYNSPISQGGNNVSGGQKQRLSIARAIAKQPEIYIFDDSFSALDYKTDIVLRKALNEQIKDGTILIVAQRISTVLNADKIIVLDEGKIVGKGTHKELLKSCEVYKQIALSQLSKEELENE